MSKWQVVEKESFGMDWHPVRYYDKALTRFDDKEQATKAAIDYITEVNCNNSLTKDEKLAAFEVYMVNESGCFLGMLDGKPWFLTHPKDVKVGAVKYAKGDIVRDKKFYLLEGKTEVNVQEIRGT